MVWLQAAMLPLPGNEHQAPLRELRGRGDRSLLTRA